MDDPGVTRFLYDCCKSYNDTNNHKNTINNFKTIVASKFEENLTEGANNKISKKNKKKYIQQKFMLENKDFKSIENQSNNKDISLNSISSFENSN